MQNAVGQSDDSPIRSVAVDIVDGQNGENGVVSLHVTLKDRGPSGNGAVNATLNLGTDGPLRLLTSNRRPVRSIFGPFRRNR
jgi:hypothetical protein